jgi:hypothetical protein
VGHTIAVGARNGTTQLEITVADADAADAQLLPLVLAERGVSVAAFGRKKHNLEDVFIDLVEGAPAHGR